MYRQATTSNFGPPELNVFGGPIKYNLISNKFPIKMLNLKKLQINFNGLLNYPVLCTFRLKNDAFTIFYKSSP